MSKDYSFSVMPSVSISRSRFARKSQHKTSFNVGKIIPLYVDEVLPGDTRSLDMASLIRMSQPIAPIMDNIYFDIYCFFVPARITWDHWKEFMGENKTSAGIPETEYSIPTLANVNGQDYAEVHSYYDYMGLPLQLRCNKVEDAKISALPFRGLALIYNRWFRNQNIIAPLAVDTSDNNTVLVSAGANRIFCYQASGVQLASKLADYFTTALPYAQKGQAVTVPLGTTAPIKYGDFPTGSIDKKTGYLNGFDALAYNESSAGGISTASGTVENILGFGYNSGVNPAQTEYGTANDMQTYKLMADLSQATAATINQLRYAFQLQKLLEKDALYGSRYWEILNAHFGIQAPDASLQEPEYLGGQRININIDQVLQTTGFNSVADTKLGTPGANSVTGGKASLFTKSFVEHGYIYVLGVARHDQTYGQGINRMWTRQGRYDFYFPVFANLGAQAILNKEIYAVGASVDNDVFGYQEAWAEYRYKPSIQTGLLRIDAANSLDYWTLGNDFNELPTLSKSFINQTRVNLDRALTTGSTGPDFIGDFYFQDIAVRPMPLYSIPGLIDHH